MAEHIFGTEAAREPAKRIRGLTKMLGGEFGPRGRFGAAKKCLKRIFSVFDLLPVARARDERGFNRAEVFAGIGCKGVSQFVNTFAGLC